MYKKILYKWACLTTKVDDKTVFFESFQGRSYSCNPKAVFEYMSSSKDYAGFNYYWGLRNGQRKIEKAAVVKFESFKYYKALAKSKYWILNSNVRRFVKPRKNQVFMQTWHGTPLKKIGLDAPKRQVDYLEEAKKYSYMISPSKYCTEKLITAFGLDKLKKEDIVLETGYARNDELFGVSDSKISSIKKNLGIDADKKVVLYAPTFRDSKISQINGFANADGMDFDQLRKELGDEYVVLFRAHYFVAKSMDLDRYKGFVKDVSTYENVNDLYLVSDLLITDYSSVFFDYANLKRPIYFYMYDYDEYRNNSRDMYIGIEELPGPVFKSEEKLIAQIKKDAGNWQVDERYEKFAAKFNYLDDGNAAKRVAEAIIK